MVRVVGGEADFHHLVIGWCAAEAGEAWTLGEESVVLLPRPEAAGACELVIEARPFLVEGRLPAQRVHVFANDWHAGRFVLTGAERLLCAVPAEVVAARPELRVALLLPDATAPAAVDARSTDSRPIALAVREIALAPALEGAPKLGWAARVEVGTSAAAVPKHAASSAEAARLERMADKAAEAPGSAMAALFDVYRQFLAGDVAAARAAFDTLVPNFAGALARNGEMLAAALEVALCLDHFEVLQRWIGRRHGFAARFALGRSNAGINGAGTLRWGVPRAGIARFVVRAALLDHPFCSLILRNFVACLPMIAAYVGSQEVVLGRVSLNIEDIGSQPGVAFCDFRPEFHVIPDPMFLGSDAYAAHKAHFTEKPVPWAERAPVAFWRGETTGWYGTDGNRIESWRDLPRIKLCRIARAAAAAPGTEGLLDAAITGIVGLRDAEAQAEMRALGLQGAHVPWSRFQRYRYQVDIDGNTNSWPGLFIKLCTGSPVLKVASPVGFRQWYYPRLVPWENYVPVKADMSDLLEKIAWLRAHDDAAERIGRAGQALAQSMTIESELRAATGIIRGAFEAAVASGVA